MPVELKAIQEACAQDDFIRPVVITGMCTAMRRRCTEATRMESACG
jgi:hypothetical protein